MSIRDCSLIIVEKIELINLEAEKNRLIKENQNLSANIAFLIKQQEQFISQVKYLTDKNATLDKENKYIRDTLIMSKMFFPRSINESSNH